jgi:hypothetical protein
MTKEEVVYIIINDGILEAHSTDCVVSDGTGAQMDEYSVKTSSWFESKHASNYRLVDQEGKRIQGEVTFIKNERYIKPIYVYVTVDSDDSDLVDVEDYCSDVEIQEDYC